MSHAIASMDDRASMPHLLKTTLIIKIKIRSQKNGLSQGHPPPPRVKTARKSMVQCMFLRARCSATCWPK